ncbi:SRSF protein kinase 2-like [Hibiscus syriacus]|uniref:SRSF protein kinase 2-like n=1 Tax=Hibiscus syriacus TaxID=106335 RepID=UPI001920F31E|nr:SRSF protein kinase 2-like [Hibiscus syriacus]
MKAFIWIKAINANIKLCEENWWIDPISCLSVLSENLVSDYWLAPRNGFGVVCYVNSSEVFSEAGWCSCTPLLIESDCQIQKSAQQFAEAAVHEIEVLRSIADGDPSNSKSVVHLIDHFKHTGPNGQHLCMVLEFLGDSLLQLIRFNRYKGLELNKVREICKCILIALDYLHRELGIIHTDLKPENVLLLSTIDPAKDPIRSGLTPILARPEGGTLNGGSTANIIEKKLKRRAKRAVANISSRRGSMGGEALKPARCLDGIDMRCKVVDFGNACWADKRFAEEIQTRQYRAPEVVLQSGYSFSVDMWSFGCIAFELATGDMMFAPNLLCLDMGIERCNNENNVFYFNDMLLRIILVLSSGCHTRRAIKGELFWIAVGGARSKDFDRRGDLKRIRRLKKATNCAAVSATPMAESEELGWQSKVDAEMNKLKI